MLWCKRLFGASVVLNVMCWVTGSVFFTGVNLHSVLTCQCLQLMIVVEIIQISWWENKRAQLTKIWIFQNREIIENYTTNDPKQQSDRDTWSIQLKRSRVLSPRWVREDVSAPFIYSKVIKVEGLWPRLCPSCLRASGSHVCSDRSCGVVILSWTGKHVW